MDKGFIFWLLMLLWLLFGGYVFRPTATAPDGRLVAGTQLLLFALLFILGWAVFGFAIK